MLLLFQRRADCRQKAASYYLPDFLCCCFILSTRYFLKASIYNRHSGINSVICLLFFNFIPARPFCSLPFLPSPFSSVHTQSSAIYAVTCVVDQIIISSGERKRVGVKRFKPDLMLYAPQHFLPLVVSRFLSFHYCYITHGV